VGRGLQLYSGRVIALGRLLLATSFLGAIAVDISQPAQAPVETFGLLIAYLVFSALVAAATWDNWWLDAKLAGPTHAVDIGLFTVLVLLTEGYTSPFFVFFVFVLLSAAIRWGWRETALTAILLIILYLVAGLFAAHSAVGFPLYRSIIRTGHLVILSLILIWFGIHQWRARIPARSEDLLADPKLDRSPLETGLTAAMTALGASRGVFLWIEDAGEPQLATCEGSELTVASFEPVKGMNLTSGAFLYDIARNRALTRDAQRNLLGRNPSDLIEPHLAADLKLDEGVAVPVRTGTGEGQLFLEDLPGLSTDHIDLGDQLSLDLAAHLQRHALLKAAGESAEARSRLTLARDLHDSVVQFLAGAAFRLEAMKRSEASGRTLEPELNELKKLMLQEQGELRGFITALRGGSQVAMADLVRDLGALADRLSRQWAIDCTFKSEAGDLMVSTNVHLDAHQLVREAVANAVRHAQATSVQIVLTADRRFVRLDLINNGAAFPSHGEQVELPQSLRERVEQAGGNIELSRGMDVTKLAIALPAGGPNR